MRLLKVITWYLVSFWSSSLRNTTNELTEWGACCLDIGFRHMLATPVHSRYNVPTKQDAFFPKL